MTTQCFQVPSHLCCLPRLSCWEEACTGCSIRSIWGEISRDSSNICHHLPPRTDPWHRLLLAPWHPEDLPGPPLHHLHACLHPLHLCFQRKVVQKKANRGEQEERWKGGEAEYEEPFVTFSAMFTLANVLFSLVGNVVYCLSLTHNAGWDKTWGVDGQGFHTLSVDDDQEYQLTLLWVLIGFLLPRLVSVGSVRQDTGHPRSNPWPSPHLLHPGSHLHLKEPPLLLLLLQPSQSRVWSPCCIQTGLKLCLGCQWQAKACSSWIWGDWVREGEEQCV